MTKVYSWRQDVAPEDEKERSIVATEQVTETKEEVFSLSQREKELEDARVQVVSAQQRVTDLEKEIANIKLALAIK